MLQPRQLYMPTTVCPEKRDQHVFCDISYKTPAILMKFGLQFSE